MPPPGTLLQGRYRILQSLGGGGMGRVYLAQDVRLGNRQVAVKELYIDQSLSPAERQQVQIMFEREANLLAGLEHPNLPRVFDHFSESGRWHLAMDYVDGETLADVVARTPEGLPEATVLDWAGQLCDVLAYLHEQTPPIIFRDLKPSNIMLDRRGRIKLIDFGIARLFNPAKQTDTLRMGTPGYAAPEQWTHGAQTDAQTDIYALGATVHHLLSGQDPSRRAPFAFEPLQAHRPDVSPPIASAVAKALAYTKPHRFTSAQEMKQALTPPPAPKPKVEARVRAAPRPVAPPITPQVIPPADSSPAPRRIGPPSRLVWTIGFALGGLCLLGAGSVIMLVAANGIPGILPLVTVTPIATATSAPAILPIFTASISPTAADTPGPSPTPTERPVLTYSVEAGDTLIGIAERFELTVDQLVAANQVEGCASLTVGQELTIPPMNYPVPTLTPLPTGISVNARLFHTVKPGDTLLTIAATYQTSSDSILERNAEIIPDPNNLPLCAVLEIRWGLNPWTPTLPGFTVTPAATATP